jgi:hypothetical protein
LPLTVMVLRLNQQWDPDREDCIAVLNRAIARLRRSDLPAITMTSELAICLTHTTAEQASVVLGRLLRLFEAYEPAVGIASLGAAASAKEPLLARARRSTAGQQPVG